MNKRLHDLLNGGRGLGRRLGGLLESVRPATRVEEDLQPYYGQNLWRFLTSGDGEMRWMEDELADEQRGRVALVGCSEAHNRALLARLRQEEMLPAADSVSYEGLFTLVTLPAPEAGPMSANGVGAANGEGGNEGFDGAKTFDDLGDSDVWTGDGWRSDRWRSDGWSGDGWGGGWGGANGMLDVVAQHELVLLLFDAAAGWQPADARWFGRLRALHTPILPVMVSSRVGTPTAEQQALLARLAYRLGICPALIHLDAPEGSAEADPTDMTELLALVERMLALRPRLAVALAQEVVCCRGQIAQRLVRSGALMSTLLGAEPVPLLDLPFHFAIQWKLALRLAAIYGRPRLDLRHHELWGVVGMNLLVRYVAQQAVKVVPVVGWTASAILSGVSTWMLGRALIRLYDPRRVGPQANWRQAWQSSVQARVVRLRFALDWRTRYDGDPSEPTSAFAYDIPSGPDKLGAWALRLRRRSDRNDRGANSEDKATQGGAHDK
ncbi:MAG: hypothetical protein R3A44_00545 [Caldilineaceae bacterium]